MDLEEFKEYLQKKDYSYELTDNGLRIIARKHVEIDTPTIPPNIVFVNWGNVTLSEVKHLPDNTCFFSADVVYLYSVETASDSVVFESALYAPKLSSIMYEGKRVDLIHIYKSTLINEGVVATVKGNPVYKVRSFRRDGGRVAYAVFEYNYGGVWIVESELEYVLKRIYGDFSVFNFGEDK